MSIMGKLCTLVALMAMFLGANARTVIDAEVDFTRFEDGDARTIKFYGWGASEEAKDRLSIKNGCLHYESTEATDPSWAARFHPIGGVMAEEGTVYTLHYKVKGSVAQNISAIGFGITPYGLFPITTEWVEGTFDYVAGANPSGDILFECGDYVGEWDIAYLRITHEGKENVEEKWKQMLTNGDAETPWYDPNVKWNDETKNFTICAWGRDMQTIAFNMAEIEQACDYTIWDVIWKLADDTESLIDETGTKNFYVKAVGDAGPYEFGTEEPNMTATGINNVVAKKNNSDVKFNIAGQRVSNDYKGMVVDSNGNKYLAK